MKLTYPACFCPDTYGSFAVVIPDLPGCSTGGKSLPEAIAMATDAASGWVLDELESGKPAPTPSDIKDVTPEPGGFVSLLLLDMDAYAERYGEKAVRKNVTVPAWMFTFAETHDLSLSKVLQEALEQRAQRA